MSLSVALFSASIMGLLVWGLLKSGRIYAYPTLAGVTFAGFVLPQVIGLTHDPLVPTLALDRLLITGTLCASMCWAGFASARMMWTGFGWNYDRARLERASIGLVVVGLSFHILIGRLPPESFGDGGWSGTAVAYLFFADLTRYALFLGLLLWLFERSRVGLIVAALASWPVVEAIVVYGRRAVTAEFVLGLLIAAYFARGWKAPRWAFIPLAVFGMLVAGTSAGDYRARAGDGFTTTELGEIPWLENVQIILALGGPEVQNALYGMDYAAQNGLYDLGTFHWDRLVFNYVPAQIVGQDLKRSLYLNWGMGTENIREDPDRIALESGYTPQPGATATGLLDAYASFGYLGCLKFFVIAWVMATLWGASLRGDLTAQLIYLLLVVDAMHAVTHNTHWFFGRWPHMALFLLPVLRYARVKPNLVPLYRPLVNT